MVSNATQSAYSNGFVREELMPLQPKDLADHLLSQGRYAFTTEEASEILSVEEAAALETVRRLRRRRAVFSPAKGLYFAVPPEYRSWGVVPGEWFIDATMRHLGRPYYIGLLSAAAIHGAAHQAPQVFQVMTDDATATRDRDLGRIRVRFYSNKYIADEPTQQITVPTGYAVVGSKETTVVDLISRPRDGGGLSNVATVVAEIGELNGSALARVASRRGRAVARRTGWLTEQFGQVDDFEALRQAARLDVGEPAQLDPSAPRRGRTDPKWRVRMNTTVEPDV